jgi:RNA polymerase sigma factor (sigma-70 family)
MSSDKTILLVETQSDQIIEQFIRNDEKVLEQTYAHNFKLVRGYVMKNNGTEADAKDIFQEAMLVAWLNLKEGKFVVKNEFSLSAYIYKISKYKWLDKLKSKRVKSTQRIGEMDYEDVEGEMSDFAETEKRLKYLTGLYSRLDQKCKAVLNQFYYQKKNLEEIAEDLNYDLGSIRTIKYRCMQKLRKMHAETPGKFEE